MFISKWKNAATMIPLFSGKKFANKIDINKYFRPRYIFEDFFSMIIICGLSSVLFSSTSAHDDYLTNFVVLESFGLISYLIIIALFWIFKPQRWSMLFFITLVSAVSGTMLGFVIGVFILKRSYTIYYFYGITIIQYTKIILSSSILFIFTFYFFISKNILRTRNEILEQEKIKRLASEKEILQTNLRLLQAQIQPHFLFNTLSNILNLIDTAPAKSKTILLDLTSYLRTSLSRTLPETTTLDQELKMIEAYLNIQKIRMGERLHFSIDVPAVLKKQEFPPLLLQPLVENAVRHGLEPKVAGGEIVIKATAENNIMKIEVIDTGMGFSDLKNTGIGIRNVRERIALLFGENGRLQISENGLQGIRAIIEVPLNDI